MAASASFADAAAGLVRRTRAGDQIARATIYRIGEETRKGSNPRAREAFALVQRYIADHPATQFVLGTEPPIVMDPPKVQARRRVDPEARKPPLPRGILDGLFDADQFGISILRAAQYRHGLRAAATVLAGGPLLGNDTVKQIGVSQFGDERGAPTQLFFYGVQFCGEDMWKETAPALDPNGRRCLAIGQCVGAARKLQAVRMPRSRISAYSEVAGWELGE